MTAIALRPADLRILQTVFMRHPGVLRAWLYGSRARGNAGRASDIDLAVEAPTASAADFARLHEEVEESALIHELDVVRLDQLPAESTLRQNIIRDAQLIYQR